TLAARMDRHCANAARVARALGEQPGVAAVLYPGLPDHPGHEIAKAQMRGFESLIEHPARMTHASVAGSPLEVPPDLIRLSVGIEDPEDLLADLMQALG